jgi:hypothetical protein
MAKVETRNFILGPSVIIIIIINIFITITTTTIINSVEHSLLDKLIVAQLVNTFPAFYRIWNLITIFTRTYHSVFSEPDESNPHL